MLLISGGFPFPPGSYELPLPPGIWQYDASPLQVYQQGALHLRMFSIHYIFMLLGEERETAPDRHLNLDCCKEVICTIESLHLRVILIHGYCDRATQIVEVNANPLTKSVKMSLNPNKLFEPDWLSLI